MIRQIVQWKFWSSDGFSSFFLLGCALVFFYPFFLFGKIPFPADTIVGMYHPWRDVVWDGLTAGVPYKNPLITDPVRQQYVWRHLAVEDMQQGQLPLWNPYSFSGTPLLGNVQSAPFYPLNIFFFFLPFSFAWGLLVFAQPLLASIFLYFYARFFRISRGAAVVGAIVFGYGGFSIAWLEWNTIMHTLLWLPLILLAKERLLRAWTWRWGTVLCLAECSAILAGHLQVLFYLMLVSTGYLLVRIGQKSYHRHIGTWLLSALRLGIPFLFSGGLVGAATAVAWIPALQFIKLSARAVDQGSWDREGWFIPWQHLVQFFAPDYFGNPATNNYWGIWNYGEFIGYIGILPLLAVVVALIASRRKMTWFFACGIGVALLFSLPTPVAKVPFVLALPFLSSSQPTRLLSVVLFCGSILAALGMDWWLNQRRFLHTVGALLVVTAIGAGCWWMALQSPVSFAAIAKRNLVFPTLLFILTTLFFLVGSLLSYLPIRIQRQQRRIFSLLFIGITLVDLFRFGWKFTPFSPAEWAYPSTSLIRKIQPEVLTTRIMATDRRILPANVSGMYHVADVSGYDPLYLLTYNQFVAAWTRNRPDITPAAFNRILTPNDPDSMLTDLLGVRYVFSFGTHPSRKLRLIASEGQTYLYENPQAFPRAFFVQSVHTVATKEEEMKQLFALGQEARSIAVTTETMPVVSPLRDLSDTIRIMESTPNRMQLETKATDRHLLVVTDPWYPTWTVRVDGNPERLYGVDFLFRGVVVPKGTHRVEFLNHWQ